MTKSLKENILKILQSDSGVIIAKAECENTRRGIKICSFRAVYVTTDENFLLHVADEICIPEIRHTKADNRKFYNRIKRFIGDLPIIAYDGGLMYKLLFEMARYGGKDYNGEIVSLVPFIKDCLPDADDFNFSTICKMFGFSEGLTGLLGIVEKIAGKYAGYIPEEFLSMKIEKAVLSYNTVTKKGIKIVVSIQGLKGKPVYYDAETKKWVANADVYLPHIIKQVENMYLLPSGKETIDELAWAWYNKTESIINRKTTRKKK